MGIAGKCRKPTFRGSVVGHPRDVDAGYLLHDVSAQIRQPHESRTVGADIVDMMRAIEFQAQGDSVISSNGLLVQARGGRRPEVRLGLERNSLNHAGRV